MLEKNKRLHFDKKDQTVNEFLILERKGYKVPFKYKNLSQIPPKLKKILEVED